MSARNRFLRWILLLSAVAIGAVLLPRWLSPAPEKSAPTIGTRMNQRPICGQSILNSEGAQADFVAKTLAEHWVPPPNLPSGPMEAMLKVSVDNTGKLSSEEYLSPSGNDAFDNSIVECISLPGVQQQVKDGFFLFKNVDIKIKFSGNLGPIPSGSVIPNHHKDLPGPPLPIQKCFRTSDTRGSVESISIMESPPRR